MFAKPDVFKKLQHANENKKLCDELLQSFFVWGLKTAYIRFIALVK